MLRRSARKRKPTAYLQQGTVAASAKVQARIPRTSNMPIPTCSGEVIYSRTQPVATPAELPSLLYTTASLGSFGQPLVLTPPGIVHSSTLPATTNPTPVVQPTVLSAEGRAPTNTDVTQLGNTVCTNTFGNSSLVHCVASTLNNNTPTETIHPSDDISRHVAQNVKQKIISGEYIDMSTLLSNPHATNSNTLQHKVVMFEGELVIQPKQEVKKIISVESWTDAFIVFISVYCSVHTSQYQNLLKYMNIIRLSAKRSSGLGWKIYDEQFRMRKSKNPSIPWEIVDSELWLLYILSGNYSTSQNMGFRQNFNAIKLKCYAFNYHGSCEKSPCMYHHSCLRCNGDHPIIYCASLGHNRYRVPVTRPQGRNVNVGGYQQFNFRYPGQPRARAANPVVGIRHNAY